MIDLSALPEITCQASYADILHELKDAYQSATGNALYPSDDITFLLEIIAYQRMVLEYGIMHESKQNLLAYAKGARLDHIAAMSGLARLDATCAMATFRFQFVAHENVIIIPKQFQIAKDDIIFQTTHDHLVAIDQTTTDITMQCTQAGTIGNGYIAGEINQIVQPMAFLSQAENITVSSGGAEKEADDAFRNRIQLFPESISAAGPEKAYIFMAKSCHPDIIDVSVSTPTTSMAELAETVNNYLMLGLSYEQIGQKIRPLMPGTVNIYPLMRGGIAPSTEMVALIQSFFDHTQKIPLCDFVFVQAPAPVSYNIEISIIADDSGQVGQIQATAEKAVTDICDNWRVSLGHDIIPKTFLAACQNIPGVYRTTVTTPGYQEIVHFEFPVVSGVQIGVSPV